MSSNDKPDGRDQRPPLSSAYDLTESLSTKMHSATLILKGLGMLIMDGMDDSSERDPRYFLEILNEYVEVSIVRLMEAQDVTEQLIASIAAR
jgi:hypothetical protein